MVHGTAGKRRASLGKGGVARYACGQKCEEDGC